MVLKFGLKSNQILAGIYSPWPSVSSTRLHNQPFRNIWPYLAFRKYLSKLLELADRIQGKTICALGDAAAMPVRAFIENFRDEFVYHVKHKKCLVEDSQ